MHRDLAFVVHQSGLGSGRPHRNTLEAFDIVLRCRLSAFQCHFRVIFSFVCRFLAVARASPDLAGASWFISRGRSPGVPGMRRRRDTVIRPSCEKIGRVNLPDTLAALDAFNPAMRADPGALIRLDRSELLVGAARGLNWAAPDSQREQWLRDAEADLEAGLGGAPRGHRVAASWDERCGRTCCRFSRIYRCLS